MNIVILVNGIWQQLLVVIESLEDVVLKLIVKDYNMERIKEGVLIKDSDLEILKYFGKG